MEIVLYAFTVSYTPGPVNLLGLTAPLRGPWGFFAGVALAIFCWFAVIGFAGQSHLTRAFKQAFGVTPSRWRALLQQR